MYNINIHNEDIHLIIYNKLKKLKWDDRRIYHSIIGYY